MLVRNLPPDSAFVRAQLHAPLGWDNQTEVTATLCDLLFQFAMSFGDGPRTSESIVKRPWESSAAPEVHLSQLASLIGE